MMKDRLVHRSRRGGHNFNDPDLAKAKLEEADYDGTPLRFMSTQEYCYMYGEAVVAEQDELESVGFVVDLQVVTGRSWSSGGLSRRSGTPSQQIKVLSPTPVRSPTSVR